MKKKWKLIFGAVIALGVIGFIFTQVTRGVHVVVREVQEREFTRSFTEEGVVVAGEEREIYSLHSAPIARLLVEEGDRVEEGTCWSFWMTGNCIIPRRNWKPAAAL